MNKAFPRGGERPTKVGSKRKTDTFFGAVQKNGKIRKKGDPIDAGHHHKETVSTEGLKYDNIKEGMLVMACVKTVEQMCIKICLPSRLTANVSPLSISDSYNKVLHECIENKQESKDYKPLSSLYEVGQIVYGKVVKVQQNDLGRLIINVSLKPSDVHANLIHSNIPKGFIFNGAISEIQDNGYIIETGIKGLRCFLLKENSKEADFSIGQLVFMKVNKITYANSDSTCICKTVNPFKAKHKNLLEVNLDNLMPTNIVNFTITGKLRDGLQGYIVSEEFKAFVNEHHLNQPLATVDDFQIDTTISARILYIMPLTKFVYLSLNMKPCSKESNYERGHIIEDAIVTNVGTGGVILALNEEHKGLISYKALKGSYGTSLDRDELLSKYAKGTQHKVRVLEFDYMSCVHICTDDLKIIDEKILSVSDVIPGDFVTAVIIAKSNKFDGYFVQVGRVKGVIEKIYLENRAKAVEENTSLRCRVIGINNERKILYLTNRTEYMSKNCKVLTSIDDAKVNAIYMGTVVKCDHSYILVRFFGNLKGILFKEKVSEWEKGELENFVEGQIANFRIKSINDDRIVLVLPESATSFGQLCTGIVTHILDSGLELNVTSTNDVEGEDKIKGFVPIRFLTNFNELLLGQLYTYRIGDKIEVSCVMKNIFSVRDVDYFKTNSIKNWSTINPGDILKASVKNIENDAVYISLPLSGYNKLVKIPFSMVRMNAFETHNVTLTPEQVIYVKILSKKKLTKTINASAKLLHVWNLEFSSTANYFAEYILEIEEIKRKLKLKNDPIAKYAIGEKVSAKFRRICADTNDWEMELVDTEIQALIRNTLLKQKNKPEEDCAYQCIVLWIDYSRKLIYLSNRSSDVAHISAEKDMPKNLIGKSGINGKVLLKLEDIVICSLKKGQNPMVFCPTRLHFNDFEKSAGADAIENEFCRLSFIHKTLPIAVFEDTWKLWQFKEKKRKITEVFDEIVPIDEIVNDSEINEEEKISAKSENKIFSTEITETDSKEKSCIPSISDFWSTDLNSIKKDEDAIENGNDDDEITEDNENVAAVGKSKKVSNSQKFKIIKEQEANLRKIEEKYADPNALPETIDQFDRLILSDPNDSKNWINYMTFHLKCAEIEKARSVGQRALKAISFRNTQDQMNIWVALLNLEQRYGSKETFIELFKDSLMYNDPLQMHLKILPILADLNKTKDLGEIISKATKKFKDKQEIWTASANAWFSVGLLDRGNQLLHKALNALPMKEHVNTIVAFATLNHKFGNTEKAEVLLDQVITSYPKRVDVWAQYIDIQIKKGDYESARHTFDRAIVQKLPLGKMRTIFKKYLEFEEKFGNAENVTKVKCLALKYVQNNTS